MGRSKAEANIRRLIEGFKGGYAAVDAVYKTVIAAWITGQLGELVNTYKGGSQERAVFAISAGILVSRSAEYDAAIEFSEVGLETNIALFGSEHPDVASSYNNSAAAHQAKGDLDQALVYGEKALAIKEKPLDEEHPDVATSYNNIAAAHQAKGDLDQALVYGEMRRPSRGRRSARSTHPSPPPTTTSRPPTRNSATSPPPPTAPPRRWLSSPRRWAPSTRISASHSASSPASVPSSPLLKYPLPNRSERTLMGL